MTLRPHHGLCLAFFQGKGYSDAFTAHMAAVQARLAREDPALRLSVGADIICARCPHNDGGVCRAAGKVERYDRAVLARCGLTDGAELSWNEFSRLVRQRILTPGRRREICQDCQWDQVCRSQHIGP